jgi:hypothetical protein
MSEDCWQAESDEITRGAEQRPEQVDVVPDGLIVLEDLIE